MQKSSPNSSQQQLLAGQTGMRVRTGLRGGVCVDVNDQVKVALQSLTDALSAGATETTTQIATDTIAASS